MTTRADVHAELRAMIEKASQHVEQIFDAIGVVRGMWHFVKSDGREAVMMSPSIPDSDVALELIRMVFKAEDVVRCLYIDEAWVVEVEGDADVNAVQEWIAQGHSATDHPQRREVVQFLAEDDTGQLVGQRAIVRPAKGQPLLGPLVIKHYDQSVGRTVGMLAPRGRAH